MSPIMTTQSLSVLNFISMPKLTTCLSLHSCFGHVLLDQHISLLHTHCNTGNFFLLAVLDFYVRGNERAISLKLEMEGSNTVYLAVC